MMKRSATARLAGFLTSQRWYGEKASAIASIKIVDSGVSGDIEHLLLEVRPAAGESSLYYVPIMRGENDRPIDAISDPAFHRLLASLHQDELTIPLTHGHLIWHRTHANEPQTAQLTGPSHLMAVEQSNSNIRYGDALVKVFRRLQVGPNPEIELTRFLTERTGFRNSPALLGWLTYVAERGGEIAVAVAQAFVPSRSDGWTATLALLDDIMSSDIDVSTAAHERSDQLFRRLGERTAELHLALASDASTPAMAPELVEASDIAGLKSGFETLLSRVAQLLSSTHLRDERTADLTSAFLDALPRLMLHADGFDRLMGTTKSRVHGDYHLGQTLLTNEGDWFILDFEGEPRRTLAERRAKTSPLKDVAGMLRSFSYARGTAERSAGASVFPVDLGSCERAARAAFLDGYLTVARGQGASFLPRSDEDLRIALDAWELDKAVYEIDYELNNRPDWLSIPLAASLKLV